MSNNKEEVVLITKDGIRHDGRKKDDLRNISFEVGVLDQADGSALIEWGKNKILAAVYGPRELHPKHMALPDRALIRCEYRMATFSVSDRKSPAPKRREKEISKILGEALEPAIFNYLYPRSVIDIFIEILQADGGSRVASVTAASLALADAGVPMRDLVVGCAAGRLGNHVVLDLDDVEDKDGEGDLPLAYLPQLDQIVLLQSDGTFTIDQFKEALDMLIPACKKIYEKQRAALTTKYSRITEEVVDSLDDSEIKHHELEITEHMIDEKKADESKIDEKKSIDKKADEKDSKAEDSKISAKDSKKSSDKASETQDDKKKDKKASLKKKDSKKSTSDKKEEDKK
ncbi:MAG: exosome complex exonuclease Rrp41 [Candidatus Heimdallarchaeota archaeon]|nr:exosome complex exonuclease Rrp41 [Candidatus Heimdallarchaeota archaeon]